MKLLLMSSIDHSLLVCYECVCTHRVGAQWWQLCACLQLSLGVAHRCQPVTDGAQEGALGLAQAVNLGILTLGITTHTVNTQWYWLIQV